MCIETGGRLMSMFCIVGIAVCLGSMRPARAQEEGLAALPPLAIGDASGWTFLNGEWTDGAEGELIPPDGTDVQYMAVAHDEEYSDFTATFRVKIRSGFSGTRLLFRLQDSTRYYAFEIPFGGQQRRVRHFWAGLVVADGTPLQRYLALNMVPGITPRKNHWYEVRVECRGARIRGWIDGRLAVDVQDDTYSAGRLGLMGIESPGAATTHFADLRVSGVAAGPSPWEGLTLPNRDYWITPCPEVRPGDFQSYPGLIRTSSGELIVEILFGSANGTRVEGRVWVRSLDNGRTWSEPEPVPDSLPGGMGAYDSPYVKQDGTLVLVKCKHIDDQSADKPEEALYTYESRDDGKTWTGPHPFVVRGEWPEEFSLPDSVPCIPLRLRDGTLLVMARCKVTTATHFQDWVMSNFIFRSTDDGKTWSAPVRADSDNCDLARWYQAAMLTETGLAETDDNVVVGLSRPQMSPFMWQMQSNDGGQTWEPAAYAAFPGYCISLTSTASGALVAVTRYPYLTAHVSWDGGKNWDKGTILDYAGWANQSAVEVEPGVVLVIYMGDENRPGQADTRILRLRPTYEGLKIDP